ncbi:MAG: sulfotransferase family 2 domain-containing protein [Pseudomonadota bacterium]
MRQFRHTASADVSLRQNESNTFALQHSWHIFGSNAVYSMIPKNGCSSIRYSIALANGCISGLQDLNWVHRNNGTFACDIKTAFGADYTFTVLRCPFRRIVSAFYDKIVCMDLQSWQLYNATRRRVHPHDITFDDFVDLITSQPRRRLNDHWRHQVDFMLYRAYDDVFCVENYAELVDTVQRKIDFEIVDTRGALRHDLASRSSEEIEDSEASSRSAFDLLQEAKNGRTIAPRCFLHDRNIARLADFYAEDIALYQEHGFGKHMLCKA